MREKVYEIINHARYNVKFTGYDSEEAKANIEYETDRIMELVEAHTTKLLNEQLERIKQTWAEDMRLNETTMTLGEDVLMDAIENEKEKI